MTDQSTDGSYRFVTCEGCKKRLPVGGSWEPETKIQCGNCGNVQSVGAETEQ